MTENLLNHAHLLSIHNDLFSFHEMSVIFNTNYTLLEIPVCYRKCTVVKILDLILVVWYYRVVRVNFL